jgi:hypothetical protein
MAIGRGDTEDGAKYDLCVNWLYLFARYYSIPEYKRHGGDYGYVPIIQKLLDDDMRKIFR